MRPWTLLGYDPRTLHTSATAVATVPEPPAKHGPVSITVGERTLSLLPQDGGRWALVGGANRLNGLHPAPFAVLRHGDVLSLGPLHVLAHDGRPPWPAPPPEVEAAVVASRGSEASLQVYDDLLLERGLDGAPASRLGVLESLWGRGLDVEFLVGLPTQVTLDFTSSFTTRGLKRWCHALTTQAPFRFLRRIDLVGPALTNPRASSGWLMELVLALEAAPLPLLDAVGLSALFDKANGAVLDRLARLAELPRVGSRELPVVEPDEAPRDVRFFQPPAPSSWFHGALPGEEPEEG